jgi:hypothetical protein
LDSPESLSAIPPVQSPSSSSVDEGSEGSSDDLKTADSLLQESNSRDQILNVADLQVFFIYNLVLRFWCKGLKLTVYLFICQKEGKILLYYACKSRRKNKI